MPIDASIYNAFAPKVQSPLDVQNGLMQQANAGLQMQQQRDAMAQTYAEQDALRSTGGDPTALRQALIARGLVKPLMAHDKNQADIANTQAQQKERESKTREQDVTTSTKALEQYRSLLPMVQNPQDYAQWVDGLYANPATKDVASQFGTPEQVKQRIPQDPAQFQQFLQQNAMGMDKFIANQTQKRGQDMTQQTSLQNNAATVGEQSRHNQSSEATARGQLGVAQAHLGIARDRLQAEFGKSDGEGLSPAAIENAAARYNMDGTLPPMGMGTTGAAGRRAVLNRAAELAVGTSGTDQRIAQMDAKAAGSALTQLTKSKTMNASFEKTANSNAELALGLSDKLPRTGLPLLNGAIQAVRAGTGSPEATQFAAANQTFVAEYAKIMSGGMGNGPVSDAARGKAEKLLTTAMTADQYKGNVRLLQTEMANRMKGFDDEEKALRSRLGGKTDAPAPAARTVARTGVDANGKKVIQYSDGTIEHAN